ncbi:MAG: hypothetical protein R3A80_00395 [Bdellovibrionota bacterium]
MKNFIRALLLLSMPTLLMAETLHFTCKPKREREEPYRTFNITIFDAETRDAKSEVSFANYNEAASTVPYSAGILNGFELSETYSTYLSSRYRQITIESGILGFTWQRDTLQLNKRHGTEYSGFFSFPEGSEQLELGWSAALTQRCIRTQ